MKKFEKIVTWIQEEVRSGRMVSGEKLPSEQELSEQFQVSRQTVRRALEELVKRILWRADAEVALIYVKMRECFLEIQKEEQIMKKNESQ